MSQEFSVHDSIRAVVWDGKSVQLLDQRLLPQTETYLTLESVTAVADAIRDMVVRGAPAIGITAAYGALLAAGLHYAEQANDWRAAWQSDLDILGQARPTAVNLAWALARMAAVAESIDGDPVPRLLAEAQAIHTEDIEGNRRMGELGAAFIESGSGVLTHCNTGSLATGGFGTALGVIRQAWMDDRISSVFADESRPWLQGARLTAWELGKDRIPVTLIADSAAAWLMANGKVKWVIVGSDRVVANGDVANKIGTYSLAVNARHHGVGFMVVAPTSTVDMGTATGADIVIENRQPGELLNIGSQRMAAEAAGAWNPVFDVTPAELVDVFVTEKGVVEKPDTGKIAALMAV